MTIDQLIWILEIVCTVLAATLMFRSFARLDEAKRDLELAKQLREDSLRTLDAALRIKNERKTI
jgi:hypothetical protein